MKKSIFFLIFLILFLVPSAIYSQEILDFKVVDGTDINSDIDTQSSTTLYQGTFYADESIWPEGEDIYKQYNCRLYQQGYVNPLIGVNYPETPSLDIPEVPATISITDEEIAENIGNDYAQLEPGKTYYLEVLAIAYVPSRAIDEIAIAQSDGVLILGGDNPPDEPDDPADDPDDEDGLTGAGNISLSSSPSSLLFAADEDSKELQLRISASGTGIVSIDSIREDRIYPLWGEDTGFPESINLDLAAGLSKSINRKITMSNLERAKALGSGTEGSFTLRYIVSGRDAWGNPVSSTLNIPAAVSGSKAAALDVQDISINLPDSPYYLGDTVIGSTISIEADGSGTVVGQVYVDDSLAWSLNPTFTISVNGSTSFEIDGPLPTESPGIHTVRVELISPSNISAQESYEVSSSESPFPTTPQQTLTLIPNVAELFNLNGDAVVNDAGDAEQYTFNGTASLRVLSMDGLELSGAEVTGLIVRYEDDNPGAPIIAGGTVEKEGGRGETLASVAGGYLKIGRVAYDHAVAADRLTARTNLNIPLLMDNDYLTLDEMGITRDGIELGSYSWDENDPKRFTAFGINFRLHDVDAEQALTILDDPVSDRYGFSMSGSIAWNENEGGDVSEKKLVSFSGLTFYTDGDFEGGLNVTANFALIPGILTITSAGLEIEDEEMSFRLNGNVANLPSPFDNENFNTTFSLAFDTAGNLSGNIVPVDELSSGSRGLDENDSTEFSFGAATVDLTYLGLELVINNGVLNRNHSCIQIGADIYLDLLSDDSAAGQEGTRIGFGNITTGEDGQSTLAGGMEISFNGGVTPPSLEGSISLLSGKSLDLGAVKASLDNLSLECDSGNFAFLFSGSFNLEVEAIEGGISFTGLRVALDGDITGPDEIDGTDLRIMDFVSVRVGAVNWGSDTTISINEDKTSGEGTARQPAIEENVEISVDSYFEICTAAINIGSEDSSLMSGEVEQLLYYRIAGEDEPSFILKGAAVNVSGCELTADIKYDRTYLRVAGGIKMQQITGAVVGKIGYIPDGEPNAGEPTFGLFVMAEGLNAMVAPSVFLDGVGGGVFINPTNEDIDTVLAVSGFDRPELDEDIASMRPAGGGDPGSFAVMLFAGVYVAEKSLVEGQAMITVTGNYFSLDADVLALEGMMHGRSYFLISWNPLYAEGNNDLEANVFDIFRIDGDLSFYAYGEDAWGIMGEVNVSMMGDEMATGGFFIGPPGFMVETTVKSGINIGLVSGYIQFSGMIWYYVVPTPDTWGAWAEVEVGGSLLWGLVSAKAGIEGALIGQGTSVLIYSVGHVSFEVCWIEVYSGSIWVSIGGRSRFDGGKGRNDYYDSLIDDARNMAAEMHQAKAGVESALSDAIDKLYQLTDEQRNMAGIALTERSGWVGQALAISFAAAEIESWPDGLPPALEPVNDLLFGEEAQDLVQMRTELEQSLQDIGDAYEELQELQAQVLTDLEEYEQILLEDLPNIRDIASSGNPFQGGETADIEVGNTTRRVQVGFSIDQGKAGSQKEELEGMHTGFAEYQDAFIEQADLLDTKLHRLDEILFESEQSFSVLMERYNSMNSSLVDFVERFIDYQQENSQQAHANIRTLSNWMGIHEGSVFGQDAGENWIEDLMRITAAGLSDTQLKNWINLRIDLINLIFQAQGGEADYMTNLNFEDTINGEPVWTRQKLEVLFVDAGMELWWEIPNSGWELSIELADERISAAVDSFHDTGTAFRDSWGNATVISDTVFDRKADLYTLLYEIYDQLAVYGTGNMGAASTDNVRTIAPEISTVDAGKTDEKTDVKPDIKSIEISRRIPVTDYFEDKRDELGPYLQFPEITDINGQLYNTNGYSAFFRGDFEASHPVDVVEYAMKIGPKGPYGPWMSLGTDRQADDAYFSAYDNQPGYFFYLRARGAGGLTIARQGTFDLEYFNPEEDEGPFISNLDISDNSPPTTPVVSLADSNTSDSEELYVQWTAMDFQSGIQRYEYAVGTYSAPEGAESDDGDDVFYIPGFGSALDPVVLPGVAGADSVPSDILSWTDAGGRTEVIIKNLDLQHGHEYVVSVRATNGTGLRSTGTSEPVLVDLTEPENLRITEFIQQTADEYPNSVKFEFTPAEDSETDVIAHYVALGSRPSVDDLYPWTEIFYDFGRIGNVPVPEGEIMYLSIKAVNSVGLEHVAVAKLRFSYDDKTAPAAPMVVTNPQQSSSDLPYIMIGWNGTEDPESGIVGYSYGISSTKHLERFAEPDILGWVDVELSEGPYFFDQLIGSGTMTMSGYENEIDEPTSEETSYTQSSSTAVNVITVVDPSILDTEYEVHRADIYLSGRVYAVVRVTNGAGLSSISYSLPIIYDQTPPDHAEVSAEQQQYRTDLLTCRLNAGDQESGIEAYGYSIVRIQDGLNIALGHTRWVSVDAPLSGDVEIPVKIREFPPPGLVYGGQYKLSFWVRNRSSLTRSAGSVVIELVPPDMEKPK